VVTHLPDIRLKTGVLPSFVRLASLVVYRKELLMAERKREIQVKFWITPVLVCLVHACIPSQGTPSPLAPSQAASVISCMVSRILTPPGRHHSGVSLSIRRFVKKAIAAAMFQCKPLFLFILGPIVLGLIRNPIWQDSGELASSFNYQSADPAF